MESVSVVTPSSVTRPLRLAPFRGLLLAPSRVGSASSARAFARPYRAVRERLADWAGRGMIEHDDSPALYLHEYTVGQITVRGIVGALDVSRHAGDQVPAVVAHEGIHPRQVDELASRMGEMGINPAPILLVHRGPEVLRKRLAQISEEQPRWDYTDRSGQRQRVWSIRDRSDLELVGDQLAEATALIADGHHRYAAYLRLQEQHPGTPWDRGLAMLVDQDDTPLFVGAIHRTLHGPDLATLEATAAELGADSVRGTRVDSLAGLAPGTLVVTDGRAWTSITAPASARDLPVAWLHDVLLPAVRSVDRLDYHHSVDDALSALAGLDTHGGGLAVLLPAVLLDQVRALVRHGGVLPEKATSFQPKPSLGVIMRTLADEEPQPG